MDLDLDFLGLEILREKERDEFLNDLRGTSHNTLGREVKRTTVRSDNNAASLFHKKHASRNVPDVDSPLIECTEATTCNRRKRDSGRPSHPHRKNFVSKKICNISF